jgi:hypothetical protein
MEKGNQKLPVSIKNESKMYVNNKFVIHKERKSQNATKLSDTNHIKSL